MKKLLSILLMTFLIVSSKGQTLPLNTNYEEVPNNAYLKDLNNELAPYVGVYKSNFEGNEITLYITKQENKLEKSTGKTYYMDALIVKYIVKNNLGITLQDTQNQTSQNNRLYSINTRPYENSVILYYSGTDCGVGWGKITLKKLNSTQLSWYYDPNSTSLEDDCPATADKTVYLPETDNLIFTKQ
ncbi:DUF6705 family protein [Chryseobacterium profundimaris]|uniref:DUF6705 domain-containing protein n=1 Tax=Chryseobacterium profundimaris TaxID=1387275 RepID=A0ABY1NVD6_9FLAO|nr:DUF6705 family protein [Chryseobacterium profundimaris]SMP19197.1 hypothetical protein SAMN06264346_10578 [Chryseobacterium profundimaris]